MRARTSLIIAIILCVLFVPVSAVTLAEIKQYSEGGGGNNTYFVNNTYLNATISVNATFTCPPGSEAWVVNIGTVDNVLLNFCVPEGLVGATGPNGTPGNPGDPGSPASIDTNATFTGDPGTNALVTNIGTTQDALLDFTIPRGATGPNGTPGLQGDPGTNGTDATVDTTQFLWVNGTNQMLASLNAGTFNISNLTDPVASMDAATKNYVLVQAGNASGNNANSSYYMRDTSLPITGLNIERDLTTGYLQILGGTAQGNGGEITLVGADYGGSTPGSIVFSVPKADKTTAITPVKIIGDTDTPYVSLENNALKSVSNIKMTESTTSYISMDDGVSNDRLYITGGNISLFAGAMILLHGADYTGTPTRGGSGGMRFAVPAASKTTYIDAIDITGDTDTPVVELNNNRIAEVGNVTTLGDALPYIPWVNWTPTLVWAGATPASVSTVARYSITGKTVNFVVYINSADSNACTGLTITLPKASAGYSLSTPFYGHEIYGSGGTTYLSLIPYQDEANNRIGFANFATATDGKRIGVRVAGTYESAVT